MSLRGRLVLAVVVVAVVALVAAGVVTYSALRASLFGNTDDGLRQTAQQLAAFGDRRFPGGPPPAVPRAGGTSPQTPPGGTAEGGPRQSGTPVSAPRVLQTRAPGLFAEVLSPTGAVRTGPFPGYQHGAAYSPRLSNPIGGFSAGSASSPPEVVFTTPSTKAGGPEFRVLAVRRPNGDVLVLGRPLTDVTNTLNQLVVIELAVTAAAVVAALLLGWWLVRLGLKPLSDVEETAERIAGSGLGHRVPGENDRTEVGRLARTLNVMLGRIERAFAERAASEAALRRSEEQLRQFVADASHELRTPLAAVSAYAELFERGARERPEDMTRVMSGIRDETARMGKLVEDLLLLARLDEGLPLESLPVDLVTVAADAVRTATTVGPGWPVTLAATEPVEVLGDERRLRQVVDNLLANVRAHTPEGTPAEVSVKAVGREAVVEVIDEGPGVDPAQAGRMFERFYRADASRSRAHGGAGLGLSIVAAIVAAHGGRAEAASRPQGGTSVTARLPLAPAGENDDPNCADAPSDLTAGSEIHSAS